MNKAGRAKRILVAYHDKCIDGFTSAWIAKRAMEAAHCEVFLIAMNYEQKYYDLLRNTTIALEVDAVHIVDFSLPKHFLLGLGHELLNVHILTLDHHKTAFENYLPSFNPEHPPAIQQRWRQENTDIEVILNMHLSGAGMCWKYYFPETDVPLLVQYVQDWDLWQFNFGDVTRAINAYLTNKDKYFDVWETIHMGLAHNFTRTAMIEEGSKLLRVQKKEVDHIVYQARKANRTFLKHPAFYVRTSLELASPVGNAICTANPEAIAIMWDVESLKGPTTQFSLRSVGDIDVSEAAKLFGGGGGHKNAAGFTLGTLDALDLIREMQGKGSDV